MPDPLDTMTRQALIAMLGLPSAGKQAEPTLSLRDRPIVLRKGGGASTVDSMSFQDEQGREVVIPTVTKDGRILTEDQAIEHYYQTGEHLGVFSTPTQATAYASGLHDAYERGDLAAGKRTPHTFEGLNTPQGKPVDLAPRRKW